MIRGGVRVGAVLVAVVLLTAGCSGSGHPRRVTLSVAPAESVFDAPVKILLKGLEAKASVTLTVSSVDSRSAEFRSSATFIADGHGRVDPTKLAPKDGDYAGVVPMGLFTSMHPTGAIAPSPLYFWSRNPQAFTITVTSGTKELAKAVIMRRGFGDGVTQTPQRLADTGFAGQYWTPAKTESHAAILQFGGSEGGQGGQLTGALYASHGYRTLSLAYFGIEGLPPLLSNIPLEYFVTALKWLGRQPGVDPKQVYVFGASRGSEAALLLAVYFPDLVHGVIVSVPSNVVLCSPLCNGPAWTLNGSPIPYTRQFNNPNPTDAPEAIIPVERIQAAIFLDCGGADGVWHSCVFAHAIAGRLAAFHRPASTLAAYPSGGHGVGLLVPYEPGTQQAESSGQGSGVNPQANIVARSTLWPRVLAFLDKTSSRSK